MQNTLDLIAAIVRWAIDTGFPCTIHSLRVGRVSLLILQAGMILLMQHEAIP